MNFKFPTLVPTSLRTLIPSAGDDGCRVMTELLFWDPFKRPSAAQVRLEADRASYGCNTAVYTTACVVLGIWLTVCTGLVKLII